MQSIIFEPEDGIEVRNVKQPGNKRSPKYRRMFQRINCDPQSLTTSMLLEMAKTGRLCGRRVKHVRFALAGKR